MNEPLAVPSAKFAFVAVTVNDTLVPVMYVASAGTLTDQMAGSAFDEVAASVSEPISTDTDTPPSDPVVPEIVNPSAFSAMFTTPSPAMADSSMVTDNSTSATVVPVTSAVQSLVPASDLDRTRKVYSVSSSRSETVWLTPVTSAWRVPAS